jgi:hypothetical protein
MRWHLMNALDKARPIGAMDTLLLDVMREIYPDATPNELHQQMDYLEDLGMIDVVKQPDGHWHGCLTAKGVDVVEYTSDCPQGIARPAKYWS